MIIVLLLTATLIAIIPVILIKQYIKSKNNIYLAISLILYVLLMLAYIQLFSKGLEISTIYILLQVLQIIVVSLVGTMYFKEKITLNKVIGTLFGIGSIYYLMK